MDLSSTIIPRSDQQNYEDYLTGSRTVTISAVTKGSSEQPVCIELVEYPGRPFKPNLTMRKLIVLAWGSDSSTYIGRRLKLVGNPEVVWAGKAVGGVEIAGMSDIAQALTVPLTITRGKKKNFTVQPLETTAAPTSTLDAVTVNEWTETFTNTTTLTALHAAWEAAGKAGVTSDPRIIAAKDARKGQLA